MAAEVGMSTYVCRWRGAPFRVPTALADNPSVTKRCPIGHRHYDGQTVENELRIAQEAGDRRLMEIAALKITIANLKGQITKLKGRK